VSAKLAMTRDEKDKYDARSRIAVRCRTDRLRGSDACLMREYKRLIRIAASQS